MAHTQESWRQRLVEVPSRPYEALSLRGKRERSIARSEEYLRSRSACYHDVAISLDGEIDWSGTGLTRSRAFHLQAWDPLEDLLVAHSETRDERFLDATLFPARSWCERFIDAGGDASDEGESFVWYDMAVGLRFHRLAYIASEYARHECPENKLLEMFCRALDLHRQYLEQEDTFASHSNHGLYQAAGQFCGARRLASLPKMANLEEQGRERIAHMVRDQFTEEGIHREHSPGYHQMIVRSLNSLVEGGAIAHPQTLDLIQRAETAFTWMLDLEGYLANFGDTDRRQKQRQIPTHQGLIAWLESGYAFARTEETYFAVSSMFHSRTHKHADDGTFLWQDRGVPILIDAGRYGYLGRQPQGSELWHDGYWYSAPERVYVERTCAHNTIEVDGRNLPRKNVTPYGSGLRYAGEQDGLFVVTLQIPTLKPIEHRRILILKPGEWLFCHDWLRGRDESSHDFRQWYNVHPDFTCVRIANSGIELRHEHHEWPLFATPLTEEISLEGMARGWQGESQAIYPGLLGWHSEVQEAFSPALTLNYHTTGTGARFAVLWSFAPVHPDYKYVRVNASGRRGRFRWTQADELLTLSFDHGDPSYCDISVESMGQN